jgi:curved DNA-binding protein CbpA
LGRRAEAEDHYAILGVGPEATGDDVRRAYRARAMELHPDRMAGATEEKKRIRREGEDGQQGQ